MKNLPIHAALTCAALAFVLSGCSKPTPQDTIESLAADPQRLQALALECRLDRAKVGDATCNMVSEARRKRFHGDGKSKYTPSTSTYSEFGGSNPAPASAPNASGDKD